MKVREPIPRPLDVVAAELLLSASQAFLVGVLGYLAVGVWSERGVAFGPVAVIVAGLGVAVGAGWLYWLLGGVGWPLAAANVPTALFLGFALVLGWSGDDFFRVDGVPLLLSLAASVYGLLCGVFLDSPRRLRWDQRPRPRAGTPVPRVSPTTQRFVAAVPRSVPRRAASPSADVVATRGSVPAGAIASEVASDRDPASVEAKPEGEPAVAQDAALAETSDGAAVETTTAVTSDASTQPEGQGEETLGSRMPTERLEKMAAPGASMTTEPTEPEADPAAIELPTAIEPKAQRSPWAWAAPPEWTRDEDDQPPRRRSAKRS